MTSSGIKRGVAAAAISALAVAGLPSLAGTASANPGDVMNVGSVGPTLNDGDQGGVVVLKTKNISQAEAEGDGTTEPGLVLFNSALTGSPNSATQAVEIIGTPVFIAEGSAADSNKTDGFDEVKVNVKVTTPADGGAANYAVVLDDNFDGAVQASEARTQVSQSTSGELADIVVSPTSQSSPENIESGDYTVSLQDSAGRTTQLDAGDTVDITPEATVTASEADLDSDELEDGTDTFTATGTTAGTYDIDLDHSASAVTETVELVVTEAANLDADEIDIVTAADDWDGFGGGTNAGTTLVRVDQNTIRFDFNSEPNQPGANVQLSVDGNGVTFGGQDMATYTTTLDSAGNGSITVTADAATVQEGDDFAVDINGFTQTIEFDRAEAASIDGESAKYFCQDDADCTVTAVVEDQFGNPVTTGEVEASRSGHNNDATPQRKPVGSDGTVDFTFTDTNATDGGTDTVLFEYFLDQFDNTAELSDNSTTIQYSATGQGSDYVISLDGENTEAADYEADDAAIIPLWDTVADDTTDPDDEDALITIANGEANQAVTLSVDNGALILEPGDFDLADGASSVDATLTAGGILPAGYRVIGTTSGLVTLTVDSAGRTETAPLTVLAQDDVDSARNVTLSGPATVPAGADQITFMAVVTDAFGNGVPGVPNGTFNKQVSGPGQYQDGDAQTDANGVLNLNVNVDDDAVGDVTLTIDAADTYGQFGAAADRLESSSNTDDGEGLSASSDVASATTTVEGQAGPVDIIAKLKGKNNGALPKDKLKAFAPKVAAGATVSLFKIKKNGKKFIMATKTANDKGNAFFRVKDRNGAKKTTYRAKYRPTPATNRAWTNKRTVR